MMDIGFNCVKPDIWLVRLMCRLGWIENALPAVSTDAVIKKNLSKAEHRSRRHHVRPAHRAGDARMAPGGSTARVRFRHGEVRPGGEAPARPSPESPAACIKPGVRSSGSCSGIPRLRLKSILRGFNKTSPKRGSRAGIATRSPPSASTKPSCKAFARRPTTFW